MTTDATEHAPVTLVTLRAPRTGRSAGEAARRTVLVVADNSQIGLWVVRSLGRAGLQVHVLACARTDPASDSSYADGVWIMNVQAQDAAYGPTVFDYARRVGAGSVMTIAEASHNALIAFRDRSHPDIHLFSPPADVFQRALDKHTLMQTCERLGIPVARGQTLSDLMASPEQVALRFPLVLRTRDQVRGQQRAPWKVAYARNPIELGRLFEENHALASNILVQEYHPGAEEHVHVLMRDGQPFMAGAYIGEHHMPLAGGITVRRVMCDHPGPMRDAVLLLQTLQWQGVATVQFHYDSASGNYIFLEINPRYCAGIGTVIRAGFDSPYLVWQSQFEPDLMQRRLTRTGLRSRILGGDTSWLRATLGTAPLPPDQARTKAWRAIAEYVYGFGPWMKDDMFMWSDPRPYFVDVGRMITKRL
jgi:predicted ATP-grasp superfamily ATP-dependent carboligase